MNKRPFKIQTSTKEQYGHRLQVGHSVTTQQLAYNVSWCQSVTDSGRVRVQDGGIMARSQVSRSRRIAPECGHIPHLYKRLYHMIIYHNFYEEAVNVYTKRAFIHDFVRVLGSKVAYVLS